MGWEGVTIMDQRVRFIAEYLEIGTLLSFKVFNKIQPFASAILCPRVTGGHRVRS